MGGEIADEAYGVGKEECVAVGQVYFSGGWVKRCKWHGIGKEIGAGHSIHEGALACTGVANDGSEGEWVFASAGSLLITDSFDFFDVAFELGDAISYESFV